MKLLLIRHAIAEDEAPNGGGDHERALTRKGREQFQALTEWLIKQEISPQRIFHSSLVRARQTADIFREVAGLDPLDQQLDTVLNPGISLSAMVQRLNDWALEDLDLVACVGHQPDMSRIAAQLVGGGTFKYSKGAIACIEFQGAPRVGTGLLRWFVSPKLVRDE